jgi:hypothetical protein
MNLGVHHWFLVGIGLTYIKKIKKLQGVKQIILMVIEF